MSASNFLHQGEAVHLSADGATYLDDGTVLSFGSKIRTLPAQGVAYVQRGATGGCEYIIRKMLESQPDLDGVLGLVGDVLHDILVMAARSAVDVPAHLHHFEIKLAGWSHERERLEGWYVASTADNESGGQYADYEPYVPRYIGVSDFGPNAGQDVNALLGLPDRPTFADVQALDPGKAMLALLQRQRATAYNFTNMTAQHIVGGFAEMVTITQKGMTRQRLHTWPDRVGAKICP
ncbi:hypothetical protein NUH86_03915 [Sphingobium sp. JS3065]|uniref:hypothetical protein n=1 Tax=Sphingobium sp. JS3065 TaxID=2970925 RepID=UPI002263D5DE|nr:hypothetical protein [Sphingobium sp. JS3065]UZW55949.1 hypothetical protein NUH86_03915 [Sphingobium sp. JS3065]